MITVFTCEATDKTQPSSTSILRDTNAYSRLAQISNEGLGVKSPSIRYVLACLINFSFFMKVKLKRQTIKEVSVAVALTTSVMLVYLFRKSWSTRPPVAHSLFWALWFFLSFILHSHAQLILVSPRFNSLIFILHSHCLSVPSFDYSLLLLWR